MVAEHLEENETERCTAIAYLCIKPRKYLLIHTNVSLSVCV